MSLYNKYRPSNFSDIVSHEVTVTALREQLINNKFSQAYIMAGTRGTGKTTTSKIFSKFIACENPSGGEPCGVCESCIDAKEGKHPDIYEIDGASNNSVDDVRRIIDEIKYPPMRSKYKVYIIDEVHMLSTNAFNALLKTLEEPPAHIIFILATTELHKIPATIRSRCQIFSFAQIEVEDISNHLMTVSMSEGIHLQIDGARLIAESADGSMRDGLSILEQLSHNRTIDGTTVEKALGLINENHTESLIEFLIERDVKSSMIMYKEIMKLGKTTSQLIESMIKYLTGHIMVADRVSEMTFTLKKLLDFRKDNQKESNVQLLFNLFIVDICSEQSINHLDLSDQIKHVNNKVIELESLVKTASSHKMSTLEKRVDNYNETIDEKPIVMKQVEAFHENDISETSTVETMTEKSEVEERVDPKKIQKEKVDNILDKLNKFKVKV